MLSTSPGTTAQDFSRRAATAFPAARGELADGAALFDGVRYLDRSADRADYDWAVAASRQRRLFERCAVLFSPVQGELDPALLAQWLLDDRLPVRFQLQLHKLLWGSTPGR